MSCNNNGNLALNITEGNQKHCYKVPDEKYFRLKNYLTQIYHFNTRNNNKRSLKFFIKWNLKMFVLMKKFSF